ncbi:MAG: aldose 1-epimerase family protein [Candidatus Humimicrobiaceae bacterium]
MKIFGKEIYKDELMRKIGDISQIGGIKYYEYSDGVSKGIRAVDLKSPCGLDMTVLLDRGMDIAQLSYKSIPISWRSATRDTSPIFYESRGSEILRSFNGGLLNTMGLTYMGLPCIDNGEELGLHGRLSNLSAEKVLADGKWDEESYVMWVQGKIREAVVFGDKLELNRKITTWMDMPKILIEDTVENIGFINSPIMILYHINIGYPVLDTSSKIIEGKVKVEPFDNESKSGLINYYEFPEPLAEFKQQLFFHDIEADSEGNSNIAIINEDFNNGEGIGIWLKFNKENLPYLVQWKQCGLGEYVCGIEPANSLVRGRSVEKEKGTLKFIKPGEKINFRVEFNILTSKKEIENFKEKVC